jgi:hypothetical protein
MPAAGTAVAGTVTAVLTRDFAILFSSFYTFRLPVAEYGQRGHNDQEHSDAQEVETVNG